MKGRFLTLGVLAFLSITNVIFAQQQNDKEKDEQNQERRKAIQPTLVLNGAKDSKVISVNLKDLNPEEEIVLTAPTGFSVSPEVIPASTKSAKVTVTLLSSKKNTAGTLTLRSGDTRSFINLIGTADALPTKDLAVSPVYKGGKDESFVKTAADGFKPSEKGYTVEYKIKTADDDSEFFPYMVTDKGIGFKAYVDGQGMGIFSSISKKDFSNPTTRAAGGLSRFYNTDGKYHVYRYAVAADNRVFVYRDGIAIDTVRAQDLGLQDDFAVESGDLVENLLKNPGFEGEFDVVYDVNMAAKIEGWDIVIGDRYNSEQYIIPQEIDNGQDFNNHILQMHRYRWADGWGAAEVVQVVDVAPNESYTLQSLARGGIKKEGDLLGKIKIQEVQDPSLETSVDVSGKTWETYSLDYTTSAACKQIRVVFYLERDKRGAEISPLEVDNVKLTGRSRTYTPKIGFDNTSSDIKYFTYDLTGAYAPAKVPEINVVLPRFKIKKENL